MRRKRKVKSSWQEWRQSECIPWQFVKELNSGGLFGIGKIRSGKEMVAVGPCAMLIVVYAPACRDRSCRTWMMLFEPPSCSRFPDLLPARNCDDLSPCPATLRQQLKQVFKRTFCGVGTSSWIWTNAFFRWFDLGGAKSACGLTGPQDPIIKPSVTAGRPGGRTERHSS